MDRNHELVIIFLQENVGTRQNIVIVSSVQITQEFTKTGKNQEVKKNGGMTVSVVLTTGYLTVQW